MADESIPGLIWTRPPERARAGRAIVDRDSVVKAAIELLDSDGIDGLSMRRLGAKLGAAAASLYWYVRTKDELLDLAFDEVMAELSPPAPTPGADWRAEVRQALDELRAMMLRHRWYPALYSTRPSIGPNALRFWAGLLDVFARAGFSGAELDHAYCLVSDYVIGTTAIHISYDRPGGGEPEAVAATHDYVRGAVRQYPAYSDYIAEYIAVTTPDQRRDARYEFALDCLLEGLAMRLPGGSR